MGKKNNSNEYMYSTPRFRFAEGRLLFMSELYELCESDGTDDIMQKLISKGNDLRDADIDSVSDKLLCDAFDLVYEISEDPSAYDLFRYPYDCHNIKCAIKATLRNVDTDGMMYSCASVPCDGIAKAVCDRDLSMYPKHMAAAATEAMELYSKTHDPSVIDITVDKAAYKDMLCAAIALGSQYMISLVKVRIDLANILMCIRMLKFAGNGMQNERLELAYIEGGNIDIGTLAYCLEGGMDLLADKLFSMGYSKVSDAISSGKGQIWRCEKAADDTLMDIAKRAKSISFGIEVGAGYLVAKETEAKNLRILISGKRSGLSDDSIKERLRESYE